MHKAKLSRTVTFRLTLFYSTFFAACVVMLLGFVYWQTASEISNRIDNILRLEKASFTSTPPNLVPDKINKGINNDQRHVNFYGFFTPDGFMLDGNIVKLPQTIPANGKIYQAILNPTNFPAQPILARALIIQLSSGNFLLLGRDAEQLEEFGEIMRRAFFWGGTLTILSGLIFGLAMSFRPLRRIEQIQQVCERIISGDIRQRIPITKNRDELDMLATIVNRMLDETGRLMSEVKGISDNIAHDLRTPLTRLRAVLYRAQQQLGDIPGNQCTMAQAISEVDSLLLRFRALLRISEIENKERRGGFKPIHLEQILGQAVSFFEPLAEDKSIHLSMKAEIVDPILGDVELLFEAITNLLDNAIKFTPKNGNVLIELIKGDNGLQINISDSGSGIRESEKTAVLNRFYRSADQLHTPGYGLGLSIVIAIIRLHNFEFELSNTNPGTRATIFCQPRIHLFAEPAEADALQQH